jgi:hypothetical protein
MESAWRSMVVVRLGAGHARLAWSKTPMPALSNLAELDHASAFAGVDRERILYDDSAPTKLERADGNWGAVAGRLRAQGGSAGATVASLASEFDRHLAPSIRQPRTKADYWRAWRLVVTWEVARKALCAVLPMSLTTLKALTWDLVCFAMPTSQVELVWKAVQARQRQFHLPPPMCEANQFSWWSKMLGSIRGRPVELKLPIQKATVRWLLVWRPDTLAAHRARLLTVVVTLAYLRVNEVARLQVCDLWFDYLMSYGVSGFEGTCSMHINRRKNDTQGKGHYPAFGRSRDQELDAVAQLRRWLELAGLAVHPSCTREGLGQGAR